MHAGAARTTAVSTAVEFLCVLVGLPGLGAVLHQVPFALFGLLALLPGSFEMDVVLFVRIVARCIWCPGVFARGR